MANTQSVLAQPPSKTSAHPKTLSPTHEPEDRRVLWPIACAREMHHRLDGHPGVTIAVWLASTISLLVYLALFTQYEWPLWQKSWHTLWPDMPTIVAVLPLCLLLLGSLMGRIWAIGLVMTYAMLQIIVTHPTVPFNALGPLIQEHPTVLLTGLLHATVPVLAGWVFLVLAISLCWPAVKAALCIMHTSLTARDELRRQAAERAATQKAWEITHQHQLRMAQLRQQALEDEQRHAALEGAVARRHQRHELSTFYKQLLGTPAPRALLDQEARTDDDVLLRSIIGDEIERGG